MFYAESKATEDIGSALDALFSILKHEKLEAVGIFTNWLNDFLASSGTIDKLDLGKITSLMEVKTMFATKLKEYEKKLRKQGLKQGIEKGERRKAMETARKMKAEGLDSALICRITGLSAKDLKE